MYGVMDVGSGGATGGVIGPPPLSVPLLLLNRFLRLAGLRE